MKVELPGESKWFADIEAGECFAFTRKQVTSVCMKVEWLSSASVAVLWSASDDWTLPHLIAPIELAGSILHSLPSAVFVASSDAKDVRADRTRHEYAPGFLIKTPTGQQLIAVKGLQREHGIPVIDIETGKASGIETDNLTFFTSWRIVTKVRDLSTASAHLVLNFRDAAPPSPRGVLANATPRRFPLRLITRNLSSGM
jgi:hypothetical protein